MFIEIFENLFCVHTSKINPVSVSVLPVQQRQLSLVPLSPVHPVGGYMPNIEVYKPVDSREDFGLLRVDDLQPSFRI
jgi:hypothetical protein